MGQIRHDRGSQTEQQPRVAVQHRRSQRRRAEAPEAQVAVRDSLPGPLNIAYGSSPLYLSYFAPADALSFLGMRISVIG